MDKSNKLLTLQAEMAGELMQMAMTHGKRLLDLQLEIAQEMAATSLKSAAEVATLRDAKGLAEWRSNALAAQMRQMTGYAQRLQSLVNEANGDAMALMTKRLTRMGQDTAAELQAAMASGFNPQDMARQMEQLMQGPVGAMTEMMKSFTALTTPPPKKKG